MAKKRGIYKICKSMVAVFCVIVIVAGGTVKVKAASVGRAISVCVTGCGNVIGAAGLSVYWDYSDGNYVGPEDYSMLYVPNDNSDSVCSFSDLKTNDYSNGWSYVQCNYLALEDDCAVFGNLYASCNTYGDQDNRDEITYVRCDHPIE